MHRIVNLLLIAIVMSSIVPTNATTAQEDNPLKIVATTTQVADLARIIGGDRVEVIGLMGGGVDPHLYEPVGSDITAMSEADIVLYSGLHLEAQFVEVFEDIGRQDIRVYAVATLTDQQGYILPTQGQPEIPDPHFWFDPRNWQLAVEGTVNILSEEDPDNTESFIENGQVFIAQLELVYEWGVEAIALIPEDKRVLITSHDAFQYFGDAFGMEVRGLQGISTEDEAGIADVQDLVDFVVENEIPVMFVESSVSPRTIESVQEAARSRGWDVEIGGELFSDAMGEDGTFSGTYIGMISENIITVVTAFGYGDDLPEWFEMLPASEDFESSGVIVD